MVPVEVPPVAESKTEGDRILGTHWCGHPVREIDLHPEARKQFEAGSQLPKVVEAFTELIDCACEIRELMDSVRKGDYKPDAFTCQPLNNAIRDAQTALSSLADGGKS